MIDWNDGMADTLRQMADRRGADDGEFSLLNVALAAAAEIERLRAENERLIDILKRKAAEAAGGEK